MWADLSIENEYLYVVSRIEPPTWINAYHCRIMGAMGVGSNPDDPLDDPLVGNVDVPSCAGTLPICGVTAKCHDDHKELPEATYNDCTYKHSIGWSFPFYGSTFSNVCISANGIIYFRNDGSCPEGPLNMPVPPDDIGAPNYSIAVFWRDFDPLTIISDEDVLECGTCSDTSALDVGPLDEPCRPNCDEGPGHNQHKGELHGFGSVYVGNISQAHVRHLVVVLVQHWL